MGDQDNKLMEEVLKELKDVRQSVKEVVSVMTDIKNLFQKYDVEEVVNDEQLREG